jgi:hypothetical protein
MIGLGRYTVRVERPTSLPSLRRGRHPGARLAAMGCVLLGVAALGTPAALAAGNGGTNLTINSVPNTISLTVSPAAATFADCSGGAAPTASTPTELGYPDGQCSVGTLAGESDGGTAPISVTNTGIAADIDVNGASAGNESGNWGLCQSAGPSETCDGSEDQPGSDQFQVQNFAVEGNGEAENSDGLSLTPTCDYMFDFTGTSALGCSATAGQSQDEGLVLTGPSATSDTTTTWSTSVTWTAVAS